MKEFKNILVAVDTRLEKHPILDEAVEIAKKNEATIKIVDAVPEFGWTVRLTMPDHEHVRDLMVQEKTETLKKMGEDVAAKGVQVSSKVLLGKTSEEIIREVLRGKHDLAIPWDGCAADLSEASEEG